MYGYLSLYNWIIDYINRPILKNNSLYWSIFCQNNCEKSREKNIIFDIIVINIILVKDNIICDIMER